MSAPAMSVANFLENSASESNKQSPKVAYVLKVYPRFSQTFVVNEILAHQNAQRPVEIFSLRRPNDGKFHASLTQVESSVNYIDQNVTDQEVFWKQITLGARELPNLWFVLSKETDASAADIFQAIRLAISVKAQAIEHLHAHFGNVATTVARLAAKMAGVTYSFTAHARDIFHENVQAVKLERKLIDASFVATVSEFNLDYLRETHGAAADGVVRIYNGLDLCQFSFSKSQERQPLIISVGRLIEKKGFSDLIDCCRILADEKTRFRCEIIGSGPLDNSLRKQIHALNLGDLVHLVGSLPSESVAERIRQASVFAAPCIVADDGDRDGLPTVLLEAMALGTVCVSTDVTGIPEAVRDDETGIIVPQRNPRQLATACQQLLAGSQRRSKLTEAARRSVESTFCVERNSAMLRQLFAQAVRSQQRAERSLP